MKKSFEIVEHNQQRIIAVDGEAFDWGIDENDVIILKMTIKKHPEWKEKLVNDLENHFLHCFSEFLGKNITLKEVNEATEKGFIDCE